MASTTDKPCNPTIAVARAQAALKMGGQYVLGTGDYNTAPADDTPWTTNKYGTGSDCAGFAICYAWMLKRHRPGFNVGAWATVSDDINCNSLLEDADHKQELATLVEVPRTGDLLVYPTIRLKDAKGNWVRGTSGSVLEWIGHVCIVETVPDGWQPGDGYHKLTVLQCHGPNGFKPGVVRTDGSIWDRHDHDWPKPEHRTYVVRMHVRQ